MFKYLKNRLKNKSQKKRDIILATKKAGKAYGETLKKLKHMDQDEKR